MPLPLIMSAALSANIMVGAFRFPVATEGIMLASTTRRFSRPEEAIIQKSKTLIFDGPKNPEKAKHQRHFFLSEIVLHEISSH